jgi:hypothetical protein
MSYILQIISIHLAFILQPLQFLSNQTFWAIFVKPWFILLLLWKNCKQNFNSLFICN